jgi:hypothetical protein
VPEGGADGGRECQGWGRNNQVPVGASASGTPRCAPAHLCATASTRAISVAQQQYAQYMAQQAQQQKHAQQQLETQQYAQQQAGALACRATFSLV